jgi:CHAD domain-containing protein
LKKPKALGKWIAGIDAETTATDAARKVLETRIEAVKIMLPLAAERAEEDLEYVHQLRVATRRADAAVRIFRPCLKRSKAKRFRGKLSALRRAAGAARECDVHMLAFVERRHLAPETEKPFLDKLIDWTRQERRQAQIALRDACRTYPSDQVEADGAALVSSIRDRESLPTLLAVARRRFPPLMDALREAGAQDLGVVDHLHQLRICGKRVRYAMEVFAACFAGDFRRAYARISALQDDLGAINDSHEMLDHVSAFLEKDASLNADETIRQAAAATMEHYRALGESQREVFLADWHAGTWSDLWEIRLKGQSSLQTEVTS